MDVTLQDFIKILENAKKSELILDDMKIGECTDVIDIMNESEQTDSKNYKYKKALKYEVSLCITEVEHSIIPKLNKKNRIRGGC